MRKRQASKAPTVSRRPSGTWETTRQDTGPSGSGPARRKAGLRSLAPPPEKKELRLRICRAGPGFGPGAAKPADPGLRSMAVRRNPRLRPRIPPSTEPELRPRDRDGGKRDVSSKPPNGEPPGLRPWSGSPRGNRLRLRPEKDPGGSGARTPGSGVFTRNRPTRDASPPRLGSGRGTVGAGGNAGPHYCLGRSRSGRCAWRSHLSGQSSRCRPASWHRA